MLQLSSCKFGLVGIASIAFRALRKGDETFVIMGILSNSEVEKGVEHGSIDPRRKWTGPFFAEGLGASLPYLSPFLYKGLFIAPLQLDQ